MNPYNLSAEIRTESPHTLTAQRDMVRDRLAAEKRDLLATSRTVYALNVAWTAAGCPGGKFDRWLGGESEEFEKHSTIQDRLRSGEAQAAELKVSLDSEATNAGRALRTALSEGLPMQAARARVQKEINAGQHRRKSAPRAPEGCTFRAIPLFALEDLEAAEGDLDALAQTAPDLDIPGGGPEKLALIVKSWREQPRELKIMLLGGDSGYAFIKKTDLAELYRRSGMAESARAG